MFTFLSDYLGIDVIIMLVKRFLYLFAVATIFFLSFTSGTARADEKINIYKFWSNYCPHCKEENVFLEKLEKERGDFEIKSFEVTSDPKNAELFKKFSDACGNKGYSVPALYIGDKSIIGYKDEQTTGKEIIAVLDYYKTNPYVDPLKNLESGGEFKSGSDLCVVESVETKRKLPLIGEVDLDNFSLPILAVVLGAVDGFNPCAMWALIALLSLLLALGNRRKVLIVGGTFLITSWLITFFFMSAFLNAFSFVKFDLAMRLIIGIVALYTSYQLFKAFQKESEECKVNTAKGKVYKQIEKLSTSTFIPFLIVGAIILAVMVNVIEFLCSINLPVVFTKILSMANTSSAERYLYIAIYDVFYMLDDIIVFLVALFSMKAFTGFNQKYTRFTKIVGAIVMLVLALILLFFPKLLAF